MILHDQIMRIKESFYVMLFYSSRKKWLVKVESGEEFHTHLGIIKMDEVIGLEYGMYVKTNLDKRIYLIEPTIHDFVMKSQRHTQIVYPKDLGFIVIRSGITNGSKVVEIGTGSAALTTYIASIVKPNGHVYTFDVNPKFMEVAKKNLVKANMLEYVTMNEYDVHSGLELSEIDAVIVDLGDPWTVVQPLYQILKGSGSFLAICPTINQLEKNSNCIKRK